MKNSHFHRDTIAGFYSLIVKIIYYLPFNISDIDKAYNHSKNLLDSLPKHSVYAERTPEYHGDYNWITLRNRLHKIAKLKKMKKLSYLSHYTWTNPQEDHQIMLIV